MSPPVNSTDEPDKRDADEKLAVTGPSPTESVSIAYNGSDTPEEEDASGGVGREMSNLRWFVVCVGLYLTAFLYGLDSTIAADVQGPILASLGELRLLPWVGTGFLLGSVATVSLFGSLYTKIEVKWLYLGSILTFEVGSAICGAAPNMQAMVVGRVVAGVGGSGVYLGGISYISVFVSAARRPIYTALISTYILGTGAILGPVIGGAFAQSPATWRWAFYINLVLGGVTAPIYIFCLPRHGTHRHEKILPRIRNLDWLGAILNAATYSLFIISCTYSGSTWPWNSGSIIALWVMTGVTIVLFALQQWTAFLTTKEDRIYPVWCLKSRSLILLYIGTAGSSAVLQCNIYYIPLFFEFTKGDDAIAVSARLLPFIFLMIFSSLFSGTLLPRFNVYAVWYLFSGIIALAGSILLFEISTGTPPRNIYGFEILTGIGCGLTFQAAYAIAMSKSLPEKATSILGFINVAQLGGGALALAIAGTVFQNVGFDTLQTALGGRGYAAGEIREALGGGYSAILNDGTPEVRAIASEAIGTTIANVFGISIGGSAAVLGAGLLMRWERVKLS
ncbi:MFS general substrate transporter [Aspergillus novofumigatus IBT 16806]|uniref:MFS general substrate transporter n=1 Tax=Aspergillus novofumigatus (strain IBT 16806) TaxID=1392255 RepID=A0A2I1CJP5_ASPN1|nr:MFS general substrate transporter [Aspergillus novofumigatus IBT 16806]PKX97839.1 MFS general substrate transporter [Aspergillus novofumigatus IBT 16806]